MNEWHLKKIPKVIHFYFGSSVLPYLRYESIMSARKYNPGWVIKLHMPAKLGDIRSPIFSSGSFMAHRRNITLKDYTQQLAPDIQIVKHDFSKYGFNNEAHEVHKSDFIRWRILAEEGGIWSDTDILYIKPMSEMPDNIPRNLNVNFGLCKYSDVNLYAIGFLFGEPGNAGYQRIHNHSLSCYTDKDCQSMGIEIFSRLFGPSQISTIGKLKSIVPNVVPLFIDPASVYGITGPNVRRFFLPNVNIGAFPKSIGFHWYGGCEKSSEAELNMTADNLHQHKYFLADIIRHIHRN